MWEKWAWWPPSPPWHKETHWAEGTGTWSWEIADWSSSCPWAWITPTSPPQLQLREHLGFCRVIPGVTSSVAAVARELWWCTFTNVSCPLWDEGMITWRYPKPWWGYCVSVFLCVWRRSRGASRFTASQIGALFYFSWWGGEMWALRPWGADASQQVPNNLQVTLPK